MATTPPQSRPRRPTLQINTTQVPSAKISSSRKIVMVDPKDPTAFNTLSNVYATVIDRSTPIQAEPVTAINTRQAFQVMPSQSQSQMPKLPTLVIPNKEGQPRAHTPYIAHGPMYPDTPLTANPKSPLNNPEFVFPSTMTATPPLSAGAVDNSVQSFTFAPSDMAKKLSLDTNIAAARPARPELVLPRTPAKSKPPPVYANPTTKPPPYTHPRTLHSILRNSPLPPSSARPPMSPRRTSLRLQEKAAKRVGYNTPLTQTIINNKYVYSHIDLLVEDASPSPMSPAVTPSDHVMTTAGAGSGDGDITPGPLEDMRRKMAGLGTSSPVTASGGIRKRKRKERKRQWTWTINNQDDDPDEEVGGAIAAIRAAEAAARAKDAERTPTGTTAPLPLPPPRVVINAPVLLQPRTYVPDSTPSLCSQDSEAEDVEMSDSSSFLSGDGSSRAATPTEMDVDNLTPLVGKQQVSFGLLPGDAEVDAGQLGMRGDTPIPPELAS